MPYYGRGLNREIVAAVNKGELPEPFGLKDVRAFVSKNNWKAKDNYVRVTLANAAADIHSNTYEKYFVRVSRGRYKLKDEYRGQNWY